MLKTLVVLLWPAGIVAILALSALLARRPTRHPVPAPAASSGRGGHHMAPASRPARSSIVGLLLLLTVGAVAVYALTTLLGVLVTHAGPTIDKPIYQWMSHHQTHYWTAAMNRATKVGNTWTTWGATVIAAICLSAFYRAKKWLPPVVLGAAIVVDHYLTLSLRHTFHRLGPPDSPLGTFPSGGCDRMLVFYGLIAYLIWREASGSRRVAIWSAGVVYAAAFSEAYSRVYLTLHWFTDAVSGLIYGTLILATFIATIRLVDGPGRKPALQTGVVPDEPAVSANHAASPPAAVAGDHAPSMP
jgi:membrane-associated phospholipid phosphatase